jgi:hypothetical protein
MNCAASEGFIQYMVASDTDTVMLYADTQLRWSAKLPFAPVDLLRANMRFVLNKNK